MKINKFRKEVLFREAAKADKAYTAAIERIYGSEDTEILEMEMRRIVAHSDVMSRAADALLASL